MILYNPLFRLPLSKTEKRLISLDPLIDNYINSLPDNVETISFDDIRLYIDGLEFKDSYGVLKGEELTDDIIMLIADSKGLTYD